MDYQEQFEVSIPSDTNEGHAIQERIVSLLESLEFPPRDVFSVRLALEEALVNAIKHGNQSDSSKKVHIGCWINADLVRIRICDEGPGFKPEDVPDPTAMENLENPSGRGLMLMKAFMNVIEFNELGNCVILEKHRGVDADED